MRYLLLATFICCCLFTSGQYKNDNVLFKTVMIDDLCAQLKAAPNAVLIDVRSKGEFEDTSQYTGLNIGRLKKAINLDINEMSTRWRELLPYKDQPMYIMCSHSQRSRRVSKMLSDSGFKNIVNVNGGLTTYNLLSSSTVCKDQLYETHNSFKLLSPLDFCKFIVANKDVFILDIRTDSAYRSIASDEKQNSLGKLMGSVNIPLATLPNSIDRIPANRKILVVDDFGADAPRAARMLADKGYKDLYVLFNGIDMLSSRSEAEVPCAEKLLDRAIGYRLLAPDEFDAMVRKGGRMKIIDVRPAEEFKNESKSSWRNIGHINGAVNIPLPELEQRVGELASARNEPIVIYHYSGAPEAHKAAKYLAGQGFQRVYVLSGGLSSLRWQAANLKGRSGLKDNVVDIPVENQ